MYDYVKELGLTGEVRYVEKTYGLLFKRTTVKLEVQVDIEVSDSNYGNTVPVYNRYRKWRHATMQDVVELTKEGVLK